MSEPDVAESPEAVLRAYFAALEAKEYNVVVHYMDPDSVAEYYKNMIDVARVAERGFTREELKLGDLDLTEIFSDELVERLTDPPPPGLFPLPLIRDYAGIETRDQLEALSPRELLIRHLEAQTTDYKLQQMLREGLPPEPDALPVSEERQVLGAVMEGDALAHVVVRSSAKYLSGRDSESLFVVTLRRTDAGWRVVFDYLLLPGLENTCYGYSNEPEEGDGFRIF